jgi:hypothetical protein
MNTPLRAEPGSISALVVALMSTFVACAALAVDGGRLVATHVGLTDHAGNAARRGVQEVTSLRSGDPKVDGDRARRAVRAYIAQHQLQGEVVVDDRSVTVIITTTVNMTLLSVIGVDDRQLSVRRTAVPMVGP